MREEPELEELNSNGQRLLAELRTVELRNAPFPHIVLDNVFAPEFYQKLLGELPQSHEYKGLFTKRKTFDLARSGYWDSVQKTLFSQAFTTTVLDRFSSYMRPELAERELQVSSVQLVKDQRGYEISPHSDDPREKAITVLLYLASSEDLKEFGTSLMVPEDPALFNVKKYKWHSWACFYEQSMVEFVPNRMFMFPVRNDSFHAVKRINRGIERDSLQLFLN